MKRIRLFAIATVLFGLWQFPGVARADQLAADPRDELIARLQAVVQQQAIVIEQLTAELAGYKANVSLPPPAAVVSVSGCGQAAVSACGQSASACGASSGASACGSASSGGAGGGWYLGKLLFGGLRGRRGAGSCGQ